MNNVTIAGRVGNAETRYAPSGDPVLQFSVADDQGRDKPPMWWNCALFGKRAESLSPYISKGQAITVTGSISRREWKDGDGSKREAFDVRVNDIALQGSRQESGKPVGNRHGGSAADKDIPFSQVDWRVV